MYPQSMLLSRNKKNTLYPCKPQFNYIKVGFKGVKIIYACFCDEIDPSKPKIVVISKREVKKRKEKKKKKKKTKTFMLK